MAKQAKSDESDFRGRLKEALKPDFDTISMETRWGDGLPDELMICKDNGQVSFVELKQFNPEGPYDSVKFDVKPEQAIFACKRVQVQTHVNSMILGRVGRDREFILLPAMPDVEWTIWVRRVISLREKPKYPLIRLKTYDQIAEMLRDNLHARYVAS